MTELEGKLFCFMDFETTGRLSFYRSINSIHLARPIEIALIFAHEAFDENSQGYYFKRIADYNSLIQPYAKSLTWEHEEELRAFAIHKIKKYELFENGLSYPNIVRGILEIIKNIKPVVNQKITLISDNPNFDTFFMDLIFYEARLWHLNPFHYSTWSPNLAGFITQTSYKDYMDTKTHKATDDVQALFNYTNKIYSNVNKAFDALENLW